jgi:hypothetical protein
VLLGSDANQYRLMPGSRDRLCVRRDREPVQTAPQWLPPFPCGAWQRDSIA